MFTHLLKKNTDFTLAVKGEIQIQITKNLGFQYQTTYAKKAEKESGTFKATLAEKEKEIVKYENIKVMGKGELYGLVNGNRQNTHANFNDRMLKPFYPQ